MECLASLFVSRGCIGSATHAKPHVHALVPKVLLTPGHAHDPPCEDDRARVRAAPPPTNEARAIPTPPQSPREARSASGRRLGNRAIPTPVPSAAIDRSHAPRHPAGPRPLISIFPSLACSRGPNWTNPFRFAPLAQSLGAYPLFEMAMDSIMFKTNPFTYRSSESGVRAGDIDYLFMYSFHVLVRPLAGVIQ